MFRIFTVFCLMLGGLFASAAPAAAQNYGYGGGGGNAPMITCQSLNYQPARCNVRLGGGGAAFLRQTIAGECGPLGSNWGWDDNGIWVRGGCQGLFAIKYPPGNGGGYAPPPPPPGGNFRSVRCESINYRPARCAMDVYGPPQLQRVNGGTCIQGQTWGWDRGGIWVNNGCRADFLVGGNPGGGGPGIGNGAGWNGGGGGIGNGAGWNGGGGGRIIECSSWQYQPARCPAPTRNGVSIVTVLGGECIRNRSWGWDENGIWVNNGCRARFQTN